MSRIGKQPVVLPKGVDATVDGSTVVVRGPKGELTLKLHAHVIVKLQEGEEGMELLVQMQDLDSKLNRSLWGTTRSNLRNMVVGVTEGYTKRLEVNGVGYKAAVNGSVVRLDVGYSHPVEYPLPTGVTGTVEKNLITLTSIDKELLGQTAAEIRKVRKPEPYKGKGIKYQDEVIRRKAGKAAKA